MKRIRSYALLGLLLFLNACKPVADVQALDPVVPEPLGPPVLRHELPRDAAALLGANLPPVSDYSRTHVYVDLIHQARRFGTPTTPWDEKALLNDEGWPSGDFGVFLMTDQQGVKGIAGTYHIVFTGRAQVSLVASGGRLGPARYDAARNQTRLELELPEGAGQLALAFTGTDGGVRDLHVIRPGYDAEQPPLFTTDFLTHIRRFSTLRFMDWLRTNNNPVRHWSERSRPERDHHASRKGEPWEHVIALANQTGKDVWINIPAAADDDYVRELARMLRARLDPALAVYVEYSNEVWNGQFGQHAFNFDAALAEVAADPASSLAYDGRRDRATLGYRRIARRGMEISEIFRGVFGDEAMMQQVRPVFASQVVNPQVSRLGLDFIAARFGPPERYFYALAGAPYFNLGARRNQGGLSAGQVLEALDEGIRQLPVQAQFERNLALARWYRLPFFAYEGGSDTFGAASIEAKAAANRDPGMEALCRRYLQTWYGQGGGLFMWFEAGASNWSSPYGIWELTTDLRITDTPRLRCIDQTRAEPLPPWQGRNRVPGVVAASAHVEASGTAPAQAAVEFRQGSWDYLLLADTAGSYRLSIQGKGAEDVSFPEVAVNGRRVAAAGEGGVLNVALQAGFNTLRLTLPAGASAMQLESLRFSR